MIEAVCIGHAAWDVSVWVAEFPAEDSKCTTDTLLECSGGPAANAACLLAKWGVGTAFAGAVGNDEAGVRILRSMQEFGVRTAAVRQFDGWPTPVSVILVNESNGTRTVVNRSRPATAHSPLGLDALRNESPRLLLLDGHELAVSLEAIERWPDALTVLDAGSLREGTRTLASRVTHLVASERFAAQFSGVADLRSPESLANAVRVLHETNGNPVVITLGERGLAAGTTSAWELLPSRPAAVVDTTGAGDIFHGALAYELLRASSPALTKEMLRRASVAAALSTERRGSSASIPSLEDWMEALTCSKKS